MCTRCQVAIKSVSSLGPRVAAVPCGQCYECRQVKKNSWTFRLRVELEELSKRGWNVEFCTLTYNDEHIPRLPLWFCKDKSVKQTPMCFSRADVNQFIKNIRNWLYRTKHVCKDDKLRFMVCCEFGEHTQRSHYHVIFATPPQIDTREFFEEVKKQWCEKGFVFPKDYNGGLDSHGYMHKPFVVDCVSAACAYCSKYVCKDLAYYSYLDKENYYKSVTSWETVYKDFVEFDKNGTRDDVDCLTRYFPFHSQSKSLGAVFIRSLDDKTLLKYLNEGVSFVGDDRLKRMPRYLSNKILFNNYYVVDSNGKRLCRRVASSFFEEHKNEIYNKKVEFIKNKLEGWKSNKARYMAIGTAESRRFCTLLGFFAKVPVRTAQHIVSYGGVSVFRCKDIDPLDFWFARYECVTNGVEVSDRLYSYAQNVDEYYLSCLNEFYFLGNKIDNKLSKHANVLALKKERDINYMREYHMFSQTA